jgi:S-formylglutathione hydrolase FrmB
VVTTLLLSTPAVMIPAVTLLLLVAVALSARPLPRRLRRRWALMCVGGAVGGALVGLALAWLLGDVADVFGIGLTPITRMWAAAGFAVIGLAVARTLPVADAPRRRRRFLALVAVVPAVLIAALGINNDFGLFRTVGDVVEAVAPTPLERLDAVTASSQLEGWVAPTGMPADGVVRQAEIPGTASGFVARPAIVWLPPAAQVANPPSLPLLIALAGQPGAPDTFLAAAQLQPILEAYQRAHHGIAPVVVIPDQNGSPDANMLCADSAMGRVDTYLSVDVLAWARASLPVEGTRGSTAIGGFSQGATCSLELSLRHPDLFSHAVAIGSELTPVGDTTVVAHAFTGDQAAADHYAPLWLMQHGGPFDGLELHLAVGAADDTFRPFSEQLHSAALAAGIHASLLETPGTAHDFVTVEQSFAAILPDVFGALGVP